MELIAKAGLERCSGDDDWSLASCGDDDYEADDRPHSLISLFASLQLNSNFEWLAFAILSKVF